MSQSEGQQSKITSISFDSSGLQVAIGLNDGSVKVNTRIHSLSIAVVSLKHECSLEIFIWFVSRQCIDIPLRRSMVGGLCSLEFLVGLCCPVLQIQSLFQTKIHSYVRNYPRPLFQTWPLRSSFQTFRK